MGFFNSLANFAISAVLNQGTRAEKIAQKTLDNASKNYDYMSDEQKEAYHEYEDRLNNLKERNNIKKEYLDSQSD